MRNLPLMIRILLLILFTGSLYSSNAQSAPGENQNANETIYRWHLVDPFTSILKVDDAGYIRDVNIKRASNTEQAQALSANILNTKISGPSFFRNKAVASYVPCSVTITNHQITIL